VACLISYGAAAVNPYLAFDTVVDQVRRGAITGMSDRKALRYYVKALSKGVLKTMSKMGISTVASYTGAQVFEAVGLASDVVERYFQGTVTQVEGIGLEGIANEALARHRTAWPSGPASSLIATWNRAGTGNGAGRASTTSSTRRRCSSSSTPPGPGATRSSRSTRTPSTTRSATWPPCGAAAGAPGVRDGAQARALDEVEPVSEIVKRFATGAMSYGAISQEAHETLAIAMNRLGAKSNSGEGGEDPERNVPDANGDSRRSAIRQVAAGRFGVTSGYLVNADDIQIKMAQGAKPGEGGQLPGKKVYPGSPKRAIRRRAWASSHRRPTTTFIRSRIWPS